MAAVEEPDIYALASEPPKPDQDDLWNTAPSPAPPASAATPEQTNPLSDQVSRQWFSVERNGRLMLLVGIWAVLLVGVCIGVSLWASGSFSNLFVEAPAIGDNSRGSSVSSADTRTPGVTSGMVRINVTWQDNVGNKPDTDATVVLIPKSFQGRVPYDDIAPNVASMGFDQRKENLRRLGVYAAVAGGNGLAVIGNVPAGDYTLIIISRNTKDRPQVSTLAEQQLRKYLDKGDSARMHKVHIEEISIGPGEGADYSHDFGTTYL